MRDFRKYTPIDCVKLRKLYAQGKTEMEIAKILNASQTGVMRARQRIGINPHIAKTSKTPMQIYIEAKERAIRWKQDHPKEAVNQFSEWQTAHRKQRTKYMRDFRKKGD